MIGKAAAGAMFLMSSACAAVLPGEDAVPLQPGACDAAAAQSLVGRTATSELGQEAMRLTGATSLRWIPEGTAVTMDFRPDRLNIELDGGNRVTAIRCG